jgi:acyl carrier protein
VTHSTEEKVRALLAKHFHIEPQEITPEANLRGDLEMDSTEVVELVVALEKELGVKIGDGEITNRQSVSDVVQIVRSKLEP